jgi:hypothetical protein
VYRKVRLIPVVRQQQDQPRGAAGVLRGAFQRRHPERPCAGELDRGADAETGHQQRDHADAQRDVPARLGIGIGVFHDGCCAPGQMEGVYQDDAHSAVRIEPLDKGVTDNDERNQRNKKIGTDDQGQVLALYVMEPP